MLSYLPERLKNITLENLKFVRDEKTNIEEHQDSTFIYRKLDVNSVTKPTANDLIARANSLLDAATKASGNKIFFDTEKEKIQKQISDNWNSENIEASIENFSDFVQSHVMPFLVKKIREGGESYSDTLERIRKAEIELASEKPRPALLNTFPVEGQTFFTYEEPVGRYTDEQLIALARAPDSEHIYSNVAYQRGEGLANFTQHATGFIDQGKLHVTQKFYSHSSLPAIDIKDPLARRDTNLRNAKQLVERLAEDIFAKRKNKTLGTAKNPLLIPITEIRLLSPQWSSVEKILNVFGILNHNPRVEGTEETTYSIPIPGEAEQIYIKPDITFMNFGVNPGRNRFVNDLQEQLNVIGFNKTMTNVFSCLEITQTSLPENLSTVRKNLKNLIDNLYKCNNAKDYNQQIEAIKVQLKINAPLEKEFFDKQAASWDRFIKSSKPEKINLINDFDTALELYRTGNYNTDDNNYRLQSLLVRINLAVGSEVATGCADNLDRNKTSINRTQSEQAFLKLHNHYPFEKDQQKSHEIHAEFQAKSTNLYSAELGSGVPGSRGHDVKELKFLKSTKLNRGLAKLRKDIYNPDFINKHWFGMVSLVERVGKTVKDFFIEPVSGEQTVLATSAKTTSSPLAHPSQETLHIDTATQTNENAIVLKKNKSLNNMYAFIGALLLTSGSFFMSEQATAANGFVNSATPTHQTTTPKEDVTDLKGPTHNKTPRNPKDPPITNKKNGNQQEKKTSTPPSSGSARNPLIRNGDPEKKSKKNSRLKSSLDNNTETNFQQAPKGYNPGFFSDSEPEQGNTGLVSQLEQENDRLRRSQFEKSSSYDFHM
jgi:hypothetical protein